ncbi:MAG: hypothetical protein L0387_38435 [Acidobacteria bacterium]|nr:hypothetical protein [Acidobacteriota bacterium]MCI0627465.1 hypothetical protein [Acidobacteriota bacterium]MCI0723033.1 hypothetical protein [Acidobacteriota bacterium]
MIRYPVTRKRLEELIEAESPGWLRRAAARTAIFRQQGFYEERSSIWSEVKPVYMKLQGGEKCAYCERKLEATDFGKGEQDVEHFRPKSSVKAWKAPQKLVDQGVIFTVAPPAGKGYYLLSYHVFNYSAACKPCNSALKKDCFPIAGPYQLNGEEPEKLLKEKSYLIYPLGSLDANPEDIIEFYGSSPRPVAKRGHKRNRARVTIEFFKLDDENKRKNLFRERAIIMLALFPQLEKMSGPASAAEKAKAKDVVDGFTRSNTAHANCARSFKRLFGSNPVEAKAVFEKAIQLVISSS